MTGLINKYIDFLTVKRYGLIGLSVIRIAIGVTTLMILISAFPIRKMIWHNSVFSNFDIHITGWGFEVFYFFTFLVFILYTLGLENVFFNILVFFNLYILYGLNSYITDGGNNLITICLFYMIFTKNAQYFAFYKGCSKKQNTFGVGVHNLFLFLILFQVCILYFFAGFAKARGQMWYSGVAPYYIFNVDSFMMIWLKSFVDFIISFPFFITLISYLSIFMQLFFPFMLLNKYTKMVGILGSICFHMSIIFIMGLVPFGVVMIAFDLAFLKDSQYKNMYSSLKAFRKRIRSKKGNSGIQLTKINHKR